VPELREKVRPARERDSGNTILSKDFLGGLLIMTGANSAVGLRSMPARYLFMDEIDAYPGDVDGEGDPILLAERRSATFKRRRKIFMVSTPTVKGFPAFNVNSRKATSGSSMCHALNATISSRCGSRNCAGRKTSRKRPNMFARAADA
jgi:phage terminase large subunit GpA-like protein